MYKYATLYQQCWHIPLSQWLGKCRARFYSNTVNVILAFNTSAQVLIMKNSTIPHPASFLGLFAAPPLWEEETLGKYGSLVYSNLP